MKTGSALLSVRRVEQLRAHLLRYENLSIVEGAAMKSRDLIPLFNALLPSLPGFSFHKRILLERPIGSVLRGIHFDPSAWSKDDFYVNFFAMPMCVPKEMLVLTFGERIPCPRGGWSMNMPDLVPSLQKAITDQALPFLTQARTLLGFADLAAVNENPHAPKNRAYALARAGLDQRAIAVIDAFLPTFVPNIAWQQQIVDDLTALRNLLTTDADEAHRKLEQWEGETIEKLGLGRYR